MISLSAAYSGVIHVTTGIRGVQPRAPWHGNGICIPDAVGVGDYAGGYAAMLIFRLVAPKITATIGAFPADSASARKMAAITAAIHQHRNR